MQERAIADGTRLRATAAPTPNVAAPIAPIDTAEPTKVKAHPRDHFQLTFFPPLTDSISFNSKFFIIK